MKFDKNLDIDLLSKETMNFTGSDIKTLINIAIINAVKNKWKSAEYKDF